MSKITLTSVAAALVFSAGMFGSPAMAMTLAAPAALGIAHADATLIQKATVVCGNAGCVPVQTKRVQHPKKTTAIR